MRITIEENRDMEEEEVVIRCREVDENILKMIHNIKNSLEVFIGYDGEHIHRIRPREIYYIEAVDSKVFFYCREKIYESRQKLYELEVFSQGMNFLRVSKSVILNLTKIKYVAPTFNGRFEAVLDNGETQIISRQYVPDLKHKLHL